MPRVVAIGGSQRFELACSLKDEAVVSRQYLASWNESVWGKWVVRLGGFQVKRSGWSVDTVLTLAGVECKELLLRAQRRLIRFLNY